MAMKDISDKQVCEAYSNRISIRNETPIEVSIRWPYEILQEMTGQLEKVCYRAMQRACDRGYINYGVSLRTGWLTEKGIALLKGDE